MYRREEKKEIAFSLYPEGGGGASMGLEKRGGLERGGWEGGEPGGEIEARKSVQIF